MTVQLSVRSYTLSPRSHAHPYAQVVIPLQGSLLIELFSHEPGSTHKQALSVRQGVLIPPGTEHRFAAHEQARFLVADLHAMPSELLTREHPFLRISDHFLSFCHFAEHQLRSFIDDETESAMATLFLRLLSLQESYSLEDTRIAQVIELLNQDLSRPHRLQDLAQHACLSLSHFKDCFQKVTGVAPLQYLTKLRMEKARALLSHSDTPIALIAEQVGYGDASAFSRRFAGYWGQPPRAYRKY